MTVCPARDYSPIILKVLSPFFHAEGFVFQEIETTFNPSKLALILEL